VVVVSERSLDANGDIYAAVLTGPTKGVFFVKRHPPYDVTDGDFLPNGDLLLLERRFSIAEGIGMRIRRIDASRLGAGNLVDGPVVLEADFGDQIDNMEGLDVSEDEDGKVFVTLVSDDNHSILQRNLVLEFRYVGDDVELAAIGHGAPSLRRQAGLLPVRHGPVVPVPASACRRAAASTVRRSA
jgi:hypothetical protein